MAELFRPARCLELSTIKYIEDTFNFSWSGIHVVKSFQQAYKTPKPVICISLLSTYTGREEIGSTDWDNSYMISFEIFANSHGQRLDLADFLLETLKTAWDYYEISRVPNSETLTYTATDHKIMVTKVNINTKVDLGEDADPYDLYRHVLQVTIKQV